MTLKPSTTTPAAVAKAWKAQRRHFITRAARMMDYSREVALEVQAEFDRHAATICRLQAA